MATVKQLQAEIEETKSLQEVTQALGEIAAIKLKTTRELVEHTTKFFADIAKVYHTVKVISAKRSDLNRYRTSHKKNGKTISVLLTSNFRFYGGLDNQLTEKFIQTTEKYATDRIIVGRFASEFLTVTNYNKPYEKLIFKKDFPSPDEVKLLVDRTQNYSRVFVYYSKFVTVLKQLSDISDISESQAEKEAQSTKIDYILEPEIDKMLDFFENQILTSLFQSLFLQAELAKTAARMVSMYDAEANAQKTIKDQKRTVSKVKHSIQNIRIIETYNSVRTLLSSIE